MSSMSVRLRRLVGALLFVPAVASAQGPGTVVAINPFLPLAGSFQGEFERRVRDNLSVAVAGSYLALGDDDDARYTNLDVKLRLYPTERALEGFGIATGLGVGRQSEVTDFACIGPDGVNCRATRRTVTGPTFSVEMQYQWLLGKSRATAVTVGGGLKRYFIDDSPTGFELFNEYMPTLRLTVGYAFR